MAMKKYAVLLLALVLAMSAIDVEAKKKKKRRSRKPAMQEVIVPDAAPGAESYNDDGMVYVEPDVMPMYPGGLDALVKFISDNLQYPEKEERAGEEGKVVVRFVVEKNGRIGRINILRSSGNRHFDNEALRVVSLIPRFNPALVGGKPVACHFTLPVSFTLPDE